LAHVTRFDDFDVFAMTLSAFHSASIRYCLISKCAQRFYCFYMSVFPHIVLCASNIAPAVVFCKQKVAVLFNTDNL
ncbi:MAG TPA: hypothetical protein VFN31_03240, partial [Candidatus Saccharimonadales bacterium]|nr:hypothetical protein [Candidatus Saccharimonadales bacterium]